MTKTPDFFELSEPNRIEGGFLHQIRKLHYILREYKMACILLYNLIYNLKHVIKFNKCLLRIYVYLQQIYN
jgi:hypothetical protein